MTTKLVLIEGFRYTQYTGKNKIISVESDRQLDRIEIEGFRLDPIKYVYGDSDEKA